MWHWDDDGFGIDRHSQWGELTWYVLLTVVIRSRTAWGCCPSSSGCMHSGDGDLRLIPAPLSWPQRQKHGDLRLLPAVHPCLKRRPWWSQAYPGDSALEFAEAVLAVSGCSLVLCVGAVPHCLRAQRGTGVSGLPQSLSLRLSRGAGCLEVLPSTPVVTTWWRLWLGVCPSGSVFLKPVGKHPTFSPTLPLHSLFLFLFCFSHLLPLRVEFLEFIRSRLARFRRVIPMPAN